MTELVGRSSITIASRLTRNFDETSSVTVVEMKDNPYKLSGRDGSMSNPVIAIEGIVNQSVGLGLRLSESPTLVAKTIHSSEIQIMRFEPSDEHTDMFIWLQTDSTKAISVYIGKYGSEPIVDTLTYR